MPSDIEETKLAIHEVSIYTEHNSSSGPNETIGFCNESGTIVRVYNRNPIPRRYIDVVKVGSEFYRSIPPDEYLDSRPGVPVNGTYRVIHYGEGPHRPVYYLYIEVSNQQIDK